MHLILPTRGEARIVSSFAIPQIRRNSLAHPVIGGGRLYLRRGESRTRMISRGVTRLRREYSLRLLKSIAYQEQPRTLRGLTKWSTWFCPALAHPHGPRGWPWNDFGGGKVSQSTERTSRAPMRFFVRQSSSQKTARAISFDMAHWGVLKRGPPSRTGELGDPGQVRSADTARHERFPDPSRVRGWGE